MLLTELLTPERVRVPLAATTKDALLEEMVAVLRDAGAVTDPSDVLRAVRAREEVLSTGIGSGVAIPHGRSAGSRALAMAAGVLSSPVEYDALDGAPVRLVFLVVGPESVGSDHVKALGRISRLVRRDALRDRLAAATSSAEFLAVLAEADAS